MKITTRIWIFIARMFHERMIGGLHNEGYEAGDIVHYDGWVWLVTRYKAPLNYLGREISSTLYGIRLHTITN